MLDFLLTALKSGRPQQFDALLTVIRGNASQNEIFTLLNDKFSTPDNGVKWDPANIEDSSRRHPESVHGRRRLTGRIHDVVNPPIQVPARPWTSVTEDDDYVSHLISLWFTWAHPWWHWVDEKSFLEAMRSRNLQSPLCTPYLVNMILADACVCVPQSKPQKFAK